MPHDPRGQSPRVSWGYSLSVTAQPAAILPQSRGFMSTNLPSFNKTQYALNPIARPDQCTNNPSLPAIPHQRQYGMAGPAPARPKPSAAVAPRQSFYKCLPATSTRKLTDSKFLTGINFFLLPFSAQKSHVKPPNHLTHCQPTTSAWHFSYSQPAILDI
jgi:hypothetical protein